MKRLAIYALGVAVMAVSACSKEEQPVPADRPTPITLTSSVAQTRTTDVDLQKMQLAAGVEVGVFVVDESSTPIDDADNAQLTADGAGNFTGETLYFPEAGSVSIYAYAPYQSGWTYGENTFTVAADQSTDAGYLASDLLYGVPAGTNSFDKMHATPVALEFGHRLAKITVKFNVGPDVDLKGATVNILNTVPTVVCNTRDGVLGEASGAAAPIRAAVYANDATTFGTSVVIVPQRLAAGTEFVQVVLADKLLNAKLNTDVTFAGGKVYTYTVNLTGDAAVIALSSTVTDWDAGDSLTGSVEEAEIPEVTWSPSSFTIPSSVTNCTYNAESGLYSWTATSNNLMTIASFANGELAQYKTLKISFSEFDVGGNSSGNVRVGYYVDDNFTSKANYYNADNLPKKIDLTSWEVDLSTVTRIVFGGGNSGVQSGSVVIKPADVVFSNK